MVFRCMGVGVRVVQGYDGVKVRVCEGTSSSVCTCARDTKGDMVSQTRSLIRIVNCLSFDVNISIVQALS